LASSGVIGLGLETLSNGGQRVRVGGTLNVNDFHLVNSAEEKSREIDIEYKNIHAWDARFRERSSAKKVLVL
jgi:hypothetical protein